MRGRARRARWGGGGGGCDGCAGLERGGGAAILSWLLAAPPHSAARAKPTTGCPDFTPGFARGLHMV